MRELISLFRELIGKRKLVTELAKADFRKRFVGSYFGIVWMFIQHTRILSRTKPDCHSPKC